MSKEIQVTVIKRTSVMNGGTVAASGDEKQTGEVVLAHDITETLLTTLLKNGLADSAFCGGRGECGRCLVQYRTAAPMPTALERKRLAPQQLRHGYRLACVSRPKNNCTIQVAFVETPSTPIVTEVINLSEKNDGSAPYEKKPINWETYDAEKKVFEGIIAVDLGTTTIAMQLREKQSGEVADTYCELNPQRSYGADVLSRIQASCAGEKDTLQEHVVGVLERGVRQFRENFYKITSDILNISCMCIAGNTTMVHLLMGFDVSTLGRSPFAPVTLELLTENKEGEFPVYIVPGISSFVGGDIVAGLYALSMLKDNFAGNSMLIDLGTNGEIVARAGDRMAATATAAGPAFEGGASANLIGTDMVAVMDRLRREHIIDETGLMCSPYFEEGIKICEKKTAQGIEAGEEGQFLLQKEDVRRLQLAKAAVRAGVEILWKILGQTTCDQIWLAGGFGYYLDVEAAFAIGLLPGQMRGKVKAAGNTSLEGAYRIGRDLLDGIISREKFEEILRKIKVINLAQEDAFAQLYVGYMNLEES